MRARTLLASALAGLSLVSFAVVSSATPAHAQAPLGGAAGPAPARGGFFGGQGGGGFGGGQGGFGGGGQGGFAAPAAEPPAMVVDGAYVFVLRRGVLYKVDKKDMKLDGQLALGPGPGGLGGGRGRGGGVGDGQP